MTACAYDIIGDIHGHACELWQLLDVLGYRRHNGVYVHPKRQALFVGDFIDRGPQQLAVLETVRAMVERGTALAVMGNHELNAVGWLKRDADSQPLRVHSDKNRKQHAAFLNEVGEGSTPHYEWVDWFMGLPLWLARPELQVVHACWSESAMQVLIPFLSDNQCLQEHNLPALFERDTPAYQAVEELLKGPELRLPEGHFFHDKDKNRRHEARIRWWLAEGSLRDAALVPQDVARELPELCLTAHLKRYNGISRPTFVGHYWLRGQPEPLSRQVACLDYSVARQGQLVAYRFDGEPVLRSDRFIAV